jgi:GTPase SAR1 family protein
MPQMRMSELLSYLKNREFSLFLGAGASLSGGGPTSAQLMDAIKTKYPIAADEVDFFDVFDKILKDEKERPAVEDFLRSLLVSMTPNNENRYLLSLPWKAVVTTNYDRIPDLVDTTLDGNRTLQTIVADDPRVDIRKEDNLYCFKVFGDMAFSYPQEGHMVLKNSDRRRAYTRQANFFSLFRDLAKSGIIVYMGYSFGDELVFDLLEDMLYKARAFPHRGFAIIPNAPSKENLEKMKKCNIEWIQGTLREFIDEAKKIFGEIPQSCSISVNPLKVHGKIIELERSTLSNIREQVKLVHQGSYLSEYNNPAMFLEGKDRSFVPFQKGWDFPRNWRIVSCGSKITEEEIENVQKFVESRCKTGNPSDNIIIALLGAAGSGKTIVARRIAHEWYTSGGNPVLFIDPSSSFIDSTAIAALLDEIWKKYRKLLGKDEKLEEMRYLIICDNASLVSSHIKKLSNDLTSAGKPIDILLVDRVSELTDEKLKEIGTNAIISLTDTVTAEESKKFVAHFQSLQVLPDLAALNYNLRNPSINTSFFALMYTCIREAQVPLKEIVIEEFRQKSSIIKKLYSLVSLIQSFGLTPCYTIATKTSDLDFETIRYMVESGPLRGVLNIVKENHSFEANHRIIADIIRSHVFSTPDLLKRGFNNVISVATEGNIVEMLLVHKMLIESPSVREELTTLQNVEELFNVATKKMKTRPLFLHLAKVQLELKQYEECRLSLDIARKVQHPSFPEALHHVFDVEGRLELSLARELLSTDENKAWEHLLRAEEAFKQADDPISSPHSLLGLSQTYYQMSRMQNDKLHSQNFLLLALDNLQKLKNNSADWFELERPLGLEAAIFRQISSTGFCEADAAAIFDRNHNANGFAFLAETKIGVDDKEALRLTDEGLKRDGHSIWLLRNRVQILKRICPDDIDEISDTLIQYRLGPKYDLQLAFELAKTEFIKGDWELADEHFRELRQKSKGYRNRLIPSVGDRWIENGKPKIFHGTIAKAPTIEEWGLLRSNAPPITRLIPVEHRFMMYEHYAKDDKIAFEIVFNMVGPQASEVKLR